MIAQVTKSKEDNMKVMVRDIVVAALNNNKEIQSSDEVVSLMKKVYAELAGEELAAENFVPTETQQELWDRTVFPDYLVCLEDGVKLKFLKRHLKLYNMTFEEYKAKWRLPSVYPHTAPNYSIKRAEIAKKMKLGKNPVDPQNV